MSEYKRLHPAAIVFNILKTIREMIVPIVLGFITFKEGALIYYIIGGSALVLLIIGYSILAWYRYTYRVEDDELKIEYGVLIRKKRYISKNRIQSIDLTSNVIHRIFKLTSVKIETASSGTGAEASLKAVKLAEGEALRKELKLAKADKERTEVETQAQENPVRQISFKRLFIAGSTSGSIGVIAAVAAFGFSELEQFIPDDFYDSTIEWVIGLSIIFLAVMAVFGLLLLWLMGIAGTMIKYGNFTITKNGEELFITRGLLEKKQLTIPVRRIQAAGIQESLIRQPLGYVTVYAEIAGGSLEKGEDFSSVLFPIMKRDEVQEFLETFLPEFAGSMDELTPLPKRARKFYLTRSSVLFIIAAIAIAFIFPQFSWIPIILVAGSLCLGLLRHRDGGFRLEDKRLTIRYRTFSRNTLIMYKKRIQAFEKKRHKLQQIQDLATLHLSIMGQMGGTHFTIKEMDEEQVNELADWYSYRN